MFAPFIRAILGAIGIVKKEVKFKKTDQEEFLKSLLPGTIILTRKINNDWIGNGIQGASNSAWQHTLGYFGKSAGQKGLLHEIVEANPGGVEIQQLDKYLNDNTQMIAFTFDLDPREFSIVKERVYSMVGKGYDYAEFLKHIIPVIPNPEDKVVCSTLYTFGYNGIRNIVLKSVDPKFATPGDIFSGCYRHVKECTATRFNF